MQLTIAQAQLIIASPILGMRLPAAVSYKFAKMAKIIQGELQTYDAERMKLIEEFHGKLSKDEKKFEFSNEDEKAFNESIAPLLAETFDIGSNFPMALPDLDLSPAELMQLDPLFDVPEPGKPAPAKKAAPKRTPLKRRK
jgi:hypothetical protein